jgi:hypothetical protein
VERAELHGFFPLVRPAHSARRFHIEGMMMMMMLLLLRLMLLLWMMCSWRSMKSLVLWWQRSQELWILQLIVLVMCYLYCYQLYDSLVYF